MKIKEKCALITLPRNVLSHVKSTVTLVHTTLRAQQYQPAAVQVYLRPFQNGLPLSLNVFWFKSKSGFLFHIVLQLDKSRGEQRITAFTIPTVSTFMTWLH